MTTAGKRLEAYWQQIRDHFLKAVDESQQQQVAFLLAHPHHGGAGLRQWLGSIVAGATSIPDRIPREVIEVYLQDNGAAPLHDCEQCGLVIPVRRNWELGDDFAPIEVYFSACPACGGSTGPYARLTHSVGHLHERQ